MAFVPEAPSLSLALNSFGPSRVAMSHTKNVTSLLSILKSKLNSKEMENLRWDMFVSFNRQVEGETVMSGRDRIVEVKIRNLISVDWVDIHKTFYVNS